MTDPLADAVASRLEQWTADRVAERLWDRDGTLWAASGHPPAEVAAWLGWLDLPDRMSARIDEIRNLAAAVGGDGYRRAAVLGMGGSSLAPELCSRLFDGMTDLRVCDSTHPDAVRGFRSWATAARTIQFVSSKSGTTTETLAFHAAMADAVPALDFVAITDPDTPLADLARAQEFRAIVEGEPAVGGRYSALSVFGLVPAAVRGVDVEAVLTEARAMSDACRAPAQENSALVLAATLGEAALAGRDKLTILTTPRLASLGDWIEQLVAESVGKSGRGVVPIVGEPRGRVDAYGADRCFVIISLASEPDDGLTELGAGLRSAGHPVEEFRLDRPEAVGGEFIRWEIATAALGIVLGLHPFDQPDVAAAKSATETLLEEFRRDGVLRLPMPLVSEPGLSAFGDTERIGDTPPSVASAIRALLEQIGDGDYFAVLAFIPPDRATWAALDRLRASVRDALGAATTVGIGPRYLHSTGQLHKGGPDNGVYLMLTADPERDLPIPGRAETFGTLIAAQAAGDLAALQQRSRRILRLHASDATSGLERLGQLVTEAVGAPAA
ncbi:MAG: transaldolase [Chloroflexi bacterium]|nr:MAG: transaldolase [Chloroflexota bacterium]